jgi:hypothetical protein
VKRKKTPCAIVCGKQEKLGSNIFENVSPITNPAVTTANILKLDTGTITEVHLTQANLLSIGQARHTGNPAGLHIAAAPAGPHAGNPAATTANGHKLDPETSIVVNLTRGNLHSIGQAQRMGNPADLHIAASLVDLRMGN